MRDSIGWRTLLGFFAVIGVLFGFGFEVATWVFDLWRYQSLFCSSGFISQVVWMLLFGILSLLFRVLLSRGDRPRVTFRWPLSVLHPLLVWPLVGLVEVVTLCGRLRRRNPWILQDFLWQCSFSHFSGSFWDPFGTVSGFWGWFEVRGSTGARMACCIFRRIDISLRKDPSNFQDGVEEYPVIPCDPAKLTGILWDSSAPRISTSFNKDSLQDSAGFSEIPSHSWDFDGSFSDSLCSGILYGILTARIECTTKLRRDSWGFSGGSLVRWYSVALPCEWIDRWQTTLNSGRSSFVFAPSAGFFKDSPKIPFCGWWTIDLCLLIIGLRTRILMVSVEWHLTGSVAGFFLGSFLGFLGTLPDSCGILWNPSELLLIDFELLYHKLMGFF